MAARPRSVLIVTDAWYPQINGVVRTLDKTAEELRKLGIEVHFITPADYRTVPMPGYSEIGLSLTTRGPVVRRVEELRPEAIHIATEGPLGWIVRRYCLRNGIPFTAFHFAIPGVATGPHIHVGLPSHRMGATWLAANPSNMSRQ